MKDISPVPLSLAAVSSALSGTLGGAWKVQPQLRSISALHKARLQHDLLQLITLTYGIIAGMALFFSCKEF